MVLPLRSSIILTEVLLLLIIGLGWPGTPVFAHAGLVRSDPPDRCTALELPRLSPDDPACPTGALLTNPPTEIHLWFSESVQPIRNGVVITAPSGKKIELGQIELKGLELVAKLNSSEEGTYQVKWQVLSGDTHPVRGRFAFSVGRTSPNLSGTSVAIAEVGAVSPLGLTLQIMGRWLHFCGYALAFGSLAFRWLVLRPLKLDSSEIIERRLWRLVGLGIILLLLAEPLALLGQTASLGTELILDPDVIGDVLASNFGRVLAQRLGVALLLWVLTGIAKQGNAAIAASVALGFGVVLALVDGQASHAISSNWVVLSMAFNTLHLAAMGVWVGGLASLLAIWQLPRLEGRRKELVMRFGTVALVALVLLIVSGSGMAWLYLAQPSNLFTTNYGVALLLKLAVLLVVLLLAWFGRRVASSPSRHTRWWTAESLTLLALLVLAALLVSLPPSV